MLMQEEKVTSTVHQQYNSLWDLSACAPEPEGILLRRLKQAGWETLNVEPKLSQT